MKNISARLNKFGNLCVRSFYKHNSPHADRKSSFTKHTYGLYDVLKITLIHKTCH
jgi:hypothetical protein